MGIMTQKKLYEAASFLKDMKKIYKNHKNALTKSKTSPRCKAWVNLKNFSCII